MSVLRFPWRAALAIASVAVACVAGLAPRRHWAALERWIPVSSAALASALAGIAAAGLIGIPGFFRFVENRAGSGVASLAPFEFAFGTPSGLLMTYLWVSNWFRVAAWYVDAARGDPLLTLVDSFVVKRGRDSAARRAHATREALEGPEVPDRLITGRAAGFPAARFVVVASRRKPGWDSGAFVITPDGWYRIGTPVERTLHAGLRTLYPLTEIRDLEVRRKSVEYELPPLSGPLPNAERNDA